MADVGLRPVCAQPCTALPAYPHSSTHLEKGGLLMVHQEFHGGTEGEVDGLDLGLGRAVWG